MSEHAPRSDDELIERLRVMGRDLAPGSDLDQRVAGRMRARRHRRIGRVAAASVLVVATAATVLVVRDDGRPRVETARTDQPGPSGSPDTAPPTGASTAADAETPTTGPETFPAADQAVNILVVGTDNGACVDPGSPYAAAFGDRAGLGERSDTIMVVRVDPVSDQAAILSFPRDLWVKVGDRRTRINAAFVRDDPTTLVGTLYVNFGLPVDHYVQLDFCGFATIVDAVGGVPVPFDRPARDTHTGLYVPEAGCRTMGGDEALAYVRSRYYQTFVDGRWETDPSTDLGRIARQQDFVQRTLEQVLRTGLGDPGRLRALFDAVDEFVVVDTTFTISRMLELGGELRSIDPAAIGRYQIDARPTTINGNAVLEPAVDTPGMQAVLAWFRGDAATPDVPTGPAAGTDPIGEEGGVPPPAASPSSDCSGT
jgi:LCP family protein required for cell wall assembly